jgi:hypothetical protein
MSGLDSRVTGVDWVGPHHGMAKFGDDTSLLVMFYNRAVQIPSASNERPVYRNEIYIKIQHPGETLNVIDRPVNDNDKQRFRKQWANFIHDRTQVPDGTPIELLFPNYPAVAETLRGFGVFTVEQCAALSAHAIDSIGRGGQEYVNRAKKYLDMSTKGAEFHDFQRQLTEKDQQIRVLEQQIVLMKEQLDKLSLAVSDPVRASEQPPYVPNYDVQSERINANAPSKELSETRKRGRPRKSAEEVAVTDPFAGNLPDED